MVFDQVKESLADILSCDAEKIDMDTDLVRDLGVDSIDTVELIMAVEETYDISISDKEAQELKTVADVVEFIEDHLEEQKRKKQRNYFDYEFVEQFNLNNAGSCSMILI